MLTYAIIALFLFLFAISDVMLLGRPGGYYRRFIQDILLLMSSLFLICFAGLRYNTGADFVSYQGLYNLISGSSFSSLLFQPTVNGLFLEKGFVFFNYAFKSLSFNLFLLCFAFLSITLKVTFFKKYSAYPLFSLALFFLISYLAQDFGQIRQGFAVGIIFWSTHFIIRRKIIPFFLMVLLAFFFHYSAIVFLGAYFIPKMNLRFIYVFLAILFFQFIFKPDIIPNLITRLPFNEAIQYKISLYLKSDQYGYSLNFSIGALLRLLISLYLVLLEPKIRENRCLYVFSAIYIWGNLFFALLSFNAIFAGRLTLYFRIFELVLIPGLIQQMIKDRYKYELISLVFSVYLFLQGYKQLSDIYRSDNYKTSYETYQSVLTHSS